jgi:anaerobic magnesium-protoporphyrin IX monomethyl ester cyclase
MKNKKILLISPQFRLVKESSSEYSKNALKRAHPVLGLLSIASSLYESGYDVKYLDTVIEGIDNVFSFDQYTYCYGLSNEMIIKQVRDFDPDIIGITCLFVSQIDQIKSISKEIKTKIGNIPIVLGGNYPSLQPEVVMENECIDYIIRGEGEQAFIQLAESIILNRKKDQFPWLVYREKGTLVVGPHIERIKDINSTVYYNWDLVPLKKYWEKALPQNPFAKSKLAIPYESSRGCPEKCIFCSTAKFFGPKFRMKTSQRVIEEIHSVVTDYGAQEIQFSDDNIAINYKRLLEICSGITDLGVNLCCPNGIRLDYIKDDVNVALLLKKMKEAGFYQVSFAVESGNEYILNQVIRKRLDLIRMKRFVAMAKDAGIRVHAFFVIGLPFENREQITDTSDYARQMNADSYSFSIATPFPGTRLWDWCKKEKLFVKDFKYSDLMFGKTIITRHDDLTIEELEQLADNLNMNFNKKNNK